MPEAARVAKLFAITLTAFQETLRRRVFYIVLLLSLLVVIMIGSQMFFMRMARHAGETQIVTNMGVHFMQMIVGFWNFAALFLALFLGAIGVSSEISARTIVHVMSRPVKRWVYLLGRWLGILIFLYLFLLVGMAGALLVSVWLNIPFASTLWLAFAENYVMATFYSGVALGFSVVMPPMLAGILALLVSILPSIAQNAIHDPRWLHRIPALVAYYLGPAQMPVNLMAESFAKERLHTDYWLYLRVLGENIFYVVAVLVVATFVFRRREIRVR
jgi:ABC-type transport system involved in multi-copper enzyme maturation permease subunit